MGDQEGRHEYWEEEDEVRMSSRRVRMADTATGRPAAATTRHISSFFFFFWYRLGTIRVDQWRLFEGPNKKTKGEAFIRS